MCQINKQKT